MQNVTTNVIDIAEKIAMCYYYYYYYYYWYCYHYVPAFLQFTQIVTFAKNNVQLFYYGEQHKNRTHTYVHLFLVLLT